MKPIDADDYFELVMRGFAHLKLLETDEMTIFTEDIFKFRWMTNLRFNSFITLADELDAATLNYYTLKCFGMAKQGRSKLGEPYVCNAAVISADVKQDAIDYALKRPRHHSNSSEYPIVIDLARGETYYYTGPIIHGILYEKFEREYINGHFAMPLGVLKQKQLEGGR